MVKVRVPATTANLGPGFDTFGCALALYNTICFTEQPSGFSFSGCDKAFHTADNLAIAGYRAVMDALRLPMPGLHIEFSSQIPISRGLGSSAALIVAGAAAANALHGELLSREDLLAICNTIEGHPDNLAPALFGGLVASFVEEGNPVIARYPIHPSLHFTAVIPDFQLSTNLARSVLPENVSYADAVFNVSRAVVLLKALETGDSDLIASSLHDRLHQPYRTALIPGFDQVEQAAQDCGCLGFCISGAGPTLLCLSDSEGFDGKLGEKLRDLPGSWQVLPLGIDHKGLELSM